MYFKMRSKTDMTIKMCLAINVLIWTVNCKHKHITSFYHAKIVSFAYEILHLILNNYNFDLISVKYEFKVRYNTNTSMKIFLEMWFSFSDKFFIPLYGACIPAHRKNPITFIPKAITRLVNRGKEKFIVLISVAVIALKLWVIRYLFTHTILFRFEAIFAKFYYYNGQVYQKATLLPGDCNA